MCRVHVVDDCWYYGCDFLFGYDKIRMVKSTRLWFRRSAPLGDRDPEFDVTDRGSLELYY